MVLPISHINSHIASSHIAHRSPETVTPLVLIKGPVVIVPLFDTRDLAAALVCLAERSPLHQR